ncbi:MAG: sugar porter family MFS transporter [Thermoguttaceae bacterium]
MNRPSLDQPRLRDGRKPYLIYLLAMVAAVGGFLFGYDLSIISGAMVFIKPAFGLNPHQVGLAMGSALLGCMAGPLVGGPLGDRWGRKWTLILAGLLFAAGAIGTAMPSGVVSFSLFRFLGGVGIGLASVVSPMFIAEMSPPRIRGGLVTVNQLAIVVGGACAVVVSYSLSFHGQWQWMLASNAAPVPLFIVGLLLVPESPRWLAQKNRLGEALDVLTLIDGSEHAETEMKDILASNEDQGSWRELIRPGMRFAMLIACVLAALQQLSGASILIEYMPTVFQDAGFPDPSKAILVNVILNIWYIVCTIAALLLVDRLGRKPLLLIGTAGMAAGMALLGTLFHLHTTGVYAVVTMCLVMGAYLVSLAPLAWLIMSEIFPNRLRGKAMTVASVCVWTACFLATNYFPPMTAYFKEAFGSPAMVFWIYAGVSLLAFFFALFVVPETKGRTLEELGASWTKPKS